MAPVGISDLPDQPWEAATSIPDSLRDKWDWELTGPASAEEIRTAKHDAECRETSGWASTYYDAEWAVAENFVDKHRQELEPIAAQYEEDARFYLEVSDKYTH